MLLNITHKGKRMHDLRNPHERHLWIFVSSTTETFPWMTACFQPFPLIRPIRTQYCLKALHYFKYPFSILDEFPNAIKWKKQKNKQRNVHISEQTKITSFNHFLCPAVGMQKISIYCQQWQRGEKKQQICTFRSSNRHFLLTIKMKANNRGAVIKRWNKEFVSSIVKTGKWSTNPPLALVLTGVSVLHFPLRAGLRSLCRGPTGCLLDDSRARAPPLFQEVNSQRMDFIQPQKKKKTEQTHKAASLSVRLPLREDVLASRNGREPQWS